MRVLGAVRLSKLTDESTSPERQREQIDMWSKLHGHEVVHVTVDTDGSGSVSPFKRQGLGPWLEPARLGEWDILVTAKLDRASRSIYDLLELVRFLQGHDKGYASAQESAADTTSASGRLFLQLLAVFAEFERARMAERRGEAAEFLRQRGQWGGGVVPYGYAPEELPGGGWRLVPDPAEAEIVRWAAPFGSTWSTCSLPGYPACSSLSRASGPPTCRS